MAKFCWVWWRCSDCVDHNGRKSPRLGEGFKKDQIQKVVCVKVFEIGKS